MSAVTLIETPPGEIKRWRTHTAIYIGVTMAQADRLPEGTIYGVVTSPHSPPTPGHHSANRWTYTRYQVVVNRRGRWVQVERQRFLTDEEIAHFEALVVMSDKPISGGSTEGG